MLTCDEINDLYAAVERFLQCNYSDEELTIENIKEKEIRKILIAFVCEYKKEYNIANNSVINDILDILKSVLANTYFYEEDEER